MRRSQLEHAICRDRGTLYPDNCTSAPTLRR